LEGTQVVGAHRPELDALHERPAQVVVVVGVEKIGALAHGVLGQLVGTRAHQHVGALGLAGVGDGRPDVAGDDRQLSGDLALEGDRRLVEADHDRRRAGDLPTDDVGGQGGQLGRQGLGREYW